MKSLLVYIGLFFCNTVFGQDVPKQLQEKITALEKDPQFKHAILSMYVVDSKTGKVVFDKNSEIGLAPASCQKVITSASAFELLGKGYRYKTEVGYDGKFSSGKLEGNLIIIGNGDPTLGSKRYYGKNDNSIFENLFLGVKSISEKIIIEDSKFEIQSIPNGWIWEDIGNYYGAGADAINWKENSFSILLKSNDQIGSKVEIINSDSIILNLGIDLISNVKADKKGSGDNAFVKLAPHSFSGTIDGTIPIGENKFEINAAIPNSSYYFIDDMKRYLNSKVISYSYKNIVSINNSKRYRKTNNNSYKFNLMNIHYSPTLDSINYWFLKKSVNLYGEAFVKTIGYEKKGVGATDTGLSIIKYFWKQRGIEPSAINIIDGSGLSPANRVTANALVTVMQYAKKQSWYSSFYNALPEMNGIKMKDGYISGVRSYTGYIKSKTGNEYTFALMVNNFDGSAATVREKLWQVLDVMK